MMMMKEEKKQDRRREKKKKRGKPLRTNEQRKGRQERRGGRENSHYGHKFNTWVNCFPSKTLKIEKMYHCNKRKTLNH